jgi:hypothetical protein
MNRTPRLLRAALAFLCLLGFGAAIPQPASAQVVRTYVAYVGAYSGSTAYNLNDMVLSGSTVYISLSYANVGNTPATSPSFWQSMGSAGSGVPSITGPVSPQTGAVVLGGPDVAQSGGTFFIGANPNTLPKPPVGSTLYPNLNLLGAGPWTSCGYSCSGGTNGGTITPAYNVTSPSLTSSALELSTGGVTNANGQVYTSLSLASLPGGTLAGITDLWGTYYSYVPASSATPQGLEGPNVVVYTGTNQLYPSIQCATNSASSTPTVATWNYWNPTASPAWTSTNISCAAYLSSKGAWHAVQVHYSINQSANTMTYQDLTLDAAPIFQHLGVTVAGNAFVSSPALKAQAQVDGSGTVTTGTTVYYDAISFAAGTASSGGNPSVGAVSHLQIAGAAAGTFADSGCTASSGVVNCPTGGSYNINGVPIGSSPIQVIYTSSISGVTGSQAVVPGSSATGDTDSASVINAVLASGNVDLEVNSGYALSTSLLLGSNTTIHCTSPQYGFIMMVASNSEVLGNLHKNAPTTTNSTSGYLVSNITDQNINVIGCTLNANSTQAVTGANCATGTASHTTNPTTGFCVFGTQWSGVGNLTMDGNDVYDSGTFLSMFGNVQYVWLKNNKFHVPTPVVALKNTDGPHFVGPFQYIHVDNNQIIAGDDSLPFNLDDGNDPSGSPAFPTYYKWGTGTDVFANNNSFDGSYYGLRIYTGLDLADRFFINNTSGVICGNAAEITANTAAGPGNIGKLLINGWQVQTTGTCNNYGVPYNFRISANAQLIQIDGVQITNPVISWPVVTQTAGTVGILSERNWDLNTQTAAFSNINAFNGGTIGQLSASGMNWYDTTGGAASFFSGSVVPTTITASNFAGPIGRILASGFSPTYQNGDAFTNTPALGTTTIYLNSVFTEASSGTVLAGTTPAVCANGCTGPWTAASGGPTGTGVWTYGTGSISLTGICTAGGPDIYCPVYINAGATNFTERFNVTSLASSSSFGIVVKWTDDANFVTITHTGSNWLVCDVVAGTTNCSGGVAFGLVTGAYTVVVSGTSISMTNTAGTITKTVSGSNVSNKIGFNEAAAAAFTSSDTITSFSVKSN